MAQKFEFTETQIEYIKENWQKESVHSMKNKFGCSWNAVTNKALELGLEAPKLKKERIWTKEEDDYILENAQRKTAEEIGNDLNRSVYAVRVRGYKIGANFMNAWTKEEEQKLKELWGYISIESIAKKINHTIPAIRTKANRMNLGPAKDSNPEYLKISEVEKYLNVSERRIRKTWQSAGLKIHSIKISKKRKVGGIKIDELMLFLEKHQDFFDSRFLEKNILGIEPKWLLEKRKKDLLNPPREYRPWQEQEISYAIQMLRLNKNYQEIGEKINRSPSAVRRKLYELNYSYMFSRYWKCEEIKILRKNYEQDYPLEYEELAKELGRSKEAIKKKCERLNYTKKRALILEPKETE